MSMTIAESIEDFEDGRKLVTKSECRNRKLISYACTIAASAGCVMFGLRAGYAGAFMALCISVMAYVLSVGHYRKHTKMNAGIDWGVIGFIIAFEIVCILAHFVSDAKKTENATTEKERTRILSSIEKEEGNISSKSEMKAMNRKDRGDAAFNNGKSRDILKDLNKKLPPPVKASEKDFYSKVSANTALPLSLVELLFNLGLGALLVVANTIHNSRVNSYYSDDSLEKYVAILIKRKLIIDSVGEEIKAQKRTATKPGVDIKGTQGDSPMDSSVFDRDFKAACDWVNGHKVGQRVFVGKMKAACKGGANWQHEAILNGLKSEGILQKKDNNGTSPLYYRKEAKQQVNLRDSYKPLQAVK